MTALFYNTLTPVNGQRRRKHMIRPGERIKALRLRDGKTQDALAAQIDSMTRQNNG